MDEKEKDFETADEAVDATGEYDEEFDMVEVDDEDVIVITDEDGVEHEAIVLDIFPFNGKEYMALFFTETEEEDGQIEFYEYEETENEDEAELTEIESDEEYNAVADAFDKLLEEDEHDHEHEED